ncbi:MULTISPECIES: aldose 1-epimerase [unclassified Sporolactobacillus]|uniref:aldose 1-epimerase n=1 Tax=unclassified Sporolactobacillus TaxID=2628533 RepID=UPI002367AD44|nr:aldose 1-epimerase [Sporolactobacillus sp. CQH2019]MDD9149681.1 aldose 1-epimerase [Sporolactobacillus sp. CQH2019]
MQDKINTAEGSVEQTGYNGLPALKLQKGTLEAILLPRNGGQLIAFRDRVKNFHFLREPLKNNMEDYRANPFLYGVPVLFPPNRYEDGRFTINGKTYRFPLNEPETHNHLHGFLYSAPWEVTGSDSGRESCSVRISYRLDERSANFRYFPHHAVFSLRYTLTESGLAQEVTVENNGSEPMPVMLGFHTTLCAPFAEESTREDCQFHLTIGERFELDERSLPTGNKLPLTDVEKAIKKGIGSPYAVRMDNHYTAAPQNGRNQATITDRKAHVRFIYDAGTDYKFWMLYNNDAKSGFVCPEPQTSMVNAPNVHLSGQSNGLFMLDPGEHWSGHSRFYYEPIG